MSRSSAPPVIVRSMNQPKPGWDLEQAVALLQQGYRVEQAARMSGFDARFLSAQVIRRARKAESPS